RAPGGPPRSRRPPPRGARGAPAAGDPAPAWEPAPAWDPATASGPRPCGSAAGTLDAAGPQRRGAGAPVEFLRAHDVRVARVQRQRFQPPVIRATPLGHPDLPHGGSPPHSTQGSRKKRRPSGEILRAAPPPARGQLPITPRRGPPSGGGRD